MVYFMKNDNFARKQTVSSPSVAEFGPDAECRVVMAADGQCVYASHGFLTSVGLTAADIKNAPLTTLLTFSSLWNQNDARSLAAGPQTVVAANQGGVIELYGDWVRSQDGADYYVASAIEAVRMIDFTPQEVRQFLNSALRLPESQKKPVASTSSVALKSADIKQFLDMSADIMCTAELDGCMLRMNPAFAKLLGYEPYQLIGKMLIDFVEPMDRPAIRDAFLGLADDTFDGVDSYIQGAIELECRVLNAQGDAHWINWRIKRENAALFCLGRDITAFKAHEAALARREQQLSEAQALAHMGHWRWEVGAATIEWSDEIYNIFGVSKDSFLPTMESINALIHRRDLGHLYQAFQRAIIQQNDYEMDFRVMTAAGTMRTIRCEGLCELDHEGEVIALYGIMQDITQQTEHARALLEAKETAETAYASKSRFLANMSHELRTPLNAIIGFSDLISKQMLGPLGNDRYLDYINGIKESGQHLLDLITDILDMSKIEAGKYDLTLENVSLNHSIKSAVQMMEGRAIDGQLMLSSHLPDDEVVLRADRRAIKQIIINLLSNAIKFTEAGGHVDVSLQRQGDVAVIQVRDTGIGIPAHKIADVTKPFEQVSNAFTRKHEGSGLGLTITKELTELHRGQMIIDSKLGMGTAITVRLPIT